MAKSRLVFFKRCVVGWHSLVDVKGMPQAATENNEIIIESTRGPRSESYRVWLHVSDVNAAVRALRLTYTLVPRFWVTDGEEKRLGLFVSLSFCVARRYEKIK